MDNVLPSGSVTDQLAGQSVDHASTKAMAAAIIDDMPALNRLRRRPPPACSSLPEVIR
jgi:hypothetical protein